MTLAPGYEVRVGDRGPSAPDPGDVGALFLVGFAAKGPRYKSNEVRSFAAWKSIYGGKVSYSPTAAAVEGFFREGGSRLVFSRLWGSGWLPGEVTLLNSGSNPVISVRTDDADIDSATDYTIQVVDQGGSDRKVIIKYKGETIHGAVYSDKTSCAAGILAVDGLFAQAEVSTWPIAVLPETPFSAGNDGHSGVTNDNFGYALEYLDEPADRGPGQVATCDSQDPDVQALIWEHARTHNRFALVAAPDTPVVDDVAEVATDLRTAFGRDAGVGMVLAPWVTVEVENVSYTIPPEALVAGAMARVDRAAVEGPGQPAAGDYGTLRWPTGVSQVYSSDDAREQLNEAGVAILREMRSGIQLYGYRTAADPILWPQYVEASGMRVLMAIRSEHERIISTFVLRTIDGNGHLLAELNGALSANLAGWYERRALYGATPAEAFSVDAVSSTVNPPEQLAQRKISASALVRTTPFAERVEVDITKIASADTI